MESRKKYLSMAEGTTETVPVQHSNGGEEQSLPSIFYIIRLERPGFSLPLVSSRVYTALHATRMDASCLPRH